LIARPRRAPVQGAADRLGRRASGDGCMRGFDRRYLAAFFFCALALASCGEKRAVREGPAAAGPAAEEPSVAELPPTQPAEPPIAEGERAREIVPGEAPRVRVFVLESREPIRMRIPSAFRIGVEAGAEPVASIDRGGEFTVRFSGGEAVLAEGRRRIVSSGSVSVETEAGGRVYLGDRSYRGGVCFRPFKGGLIAINILDIDDYIKGVLPSEIGYLKPNQFEAYRAQAIASRSYALSKLEEKKGELYDLNATVMDQVYAGAEAEHAAASRAVDETRGLVCTFLGEPIKAYYCSCCGGHTADIRTVWPWKTPYPYLYGVRDTVAGTNGESLCRGSKNFRWRAHWSGSTLSGILKNTVPAELRVPAAKVGRLADIRVMGTAPDGRVTGIEIVTDRGNFEVLGDRIRWVLKPDPASKAILKSTLCKIDVSVSGDRVTAVDMIGGGNGHGVGMCQTGAIRMAELGYSGEDIIAHYYPGSRIELVYR
jgi:stage II sporulation protein D